MKMPPPEALASMAKLYDRVTAEAERMAGVGEGKLSAAEYGSIAVRVYDAVRQAAIQKRREGRTQ